MREIERMCECVFERENERDEKREETECASDQNAVQFQLKILNKYLEQVA